ncbi:MAG: 30S ribosomal protein S7 [Candidatus Magasanikbacteria bacterium]
MSRGSRTPKRVIAPDPMYRSELLAKFINFVMKDGKKSVAQHVVYEGLKILAEKRKGDALKLFEQAIEAVRPQVEVRSRRVGGANYQVPMPVMGYRQNALAFRWIVGALEARKGVRMQEKLAQELSDILDGTGGSLRKKEDVHRMADANKAFAHFARFVS